MKRFINPSLVAFISLAVLAGLAVAGSLTPTTAPGSTMHSLAEVYASIASNSFDSSGITADANGSLMQNLKYIEANIGGANLWASNSFGIYETDRNVGIASASPTETLSVNGNMRLTGQVAIGSSISVGNADGFGLGDTATLAVNRAVTDISTALSTYGIYNDLTVDPTGPPAGFAAIAGTWNNVTTPGTNTQDFSTNSIYSAVFNVRHSGTGNLANLTGVYSIAQADTVGVVASLSALTTQVYSSSSGVAGSAYGLFVSPPFPGSAIGNNYGVYIGDESGSGAVSSYNLYSAGTDSTNYFAGDVGVGITAPYAKLTVKGGGLASENLILASSSASIMTPVRGFQGYTQLSGGLGTGGGDSGAMTPMPRLTNAGNLVNIGAIQAGETLLTRGGTFAAEVTYGTGSNPDDVALADLNGDGKVDMVVTDSNDVPSKFSVLMNNGDGTFATKVDYSNGNNFFFGIAAADVNGDGRPDVVVANEGTTIVSVFLNHGDGTFAPGVNYTTGSRAYRVALGDLNGDGKPDIVVTNFVDNTVSVLMNHGDGTFAGQVTYAVGSKPASVALADLNGDGKADIAVANDNSNTVSVLMNNGDGTFAGQVTYGVGTTPYSVAAADVNGDAKPDLVVANSGGTTVSVLINNGDGTFAAHVSYSVGTNPHAVALADINGDGKPDIVASNFPDHTVSVLMNNGDGTFASQVTYGTSGTAAGVALADLNGDGKPDIVVADASTNNVSVLMNQASTIFYAQASSGYVGIGTNAPAAPLHVASLSAGSDGSTLLRLQDENSTCDFTANAGGPACGSDLRLKKNVVPLGDGILAKIASLSVVNYQWKTDGPLAPVQTGFIAQDVQQLFPDLVATSSWIDGKPALFLSQNGFIPYLVKAVQEQQEEIDAIRTGFASGSAGSYVASNPGFDDLFSTIIDAFRNVLGIVFQKGMVQADHLCAGSTCVDQAQLQQLLDRSHVDSATPMPDISPTASASDTPTPSVAPSDAPSPSPSDIPSPSDTPASSSMP
ncbi:MAG TPA: FG-GAP-like repeat-containing protein [Candidatus Paceibacterota bacterium]|nr:FG-GAP-like repeat-containing protein [Candidatus Paceibacterota bacterium]